MRRSLSKNLKYAAAVGARNVVIVGDKEFAKGVVTLRNMATGDQKEVKIASITEAMKGQK
jgi:histidyl-tRNA synthetase